MLDFSLLHFRSFFGNINFFGGPSTTSVKSSAKLQQIEEENQDAMFIILSDVWLDQIKVSPRKFVTQNPCCLSSRQQDETQSCFPSLNEPRHKKTGLRGFRPGLTQTGLYSLYIKLEA